MHGLNKLYPIIAQAVANKNPLLLRLQLIPLGIPANGKRNQRPTVC